MLARLGERAFVDARLERVFERHHQLDALERAETELLDRRVRRHIVASRVLRDERRQRIADRSARDAARPPLFTQSRIAARFSLRVPSVRGSSGSGQTSARRIFW